jgi:hypothetical protein
VWRGFLRNQGAGASGPAALFLADNKGRSKGLAGQVPLAARLPPQTSDQGLCALPLPRGSADVHHRGSREPRAAAGPERPARDPSAGKLNPEGARQQPLAETQPGKTDPSPSRPQPQASRGSGNLDPSGWRPAEDEQIGAIPRTRTSVGSPAEVGPRPLRATSGTGYPGPLRLPACGRWRSRLRVRMRLGPGNRCGAPSLGPAGVRGEAISFLRVSKAFPVPSFLRHKEPTASFPRPAPTQSRAHPRLGFSLLTSSPTFRELDPS